MFVRLKKDLLELHSRAHGRLEASSWIPVKFRSCALDGGRHQEHSGKPKCRGFTDATLFTLRGASHQAPRSEPAAERPSETKAFPQPSSVPSPALPHSEAERTTPLHHRRRADLPSCPSADYSIEPGALGRQFAAVQAIWLSKAAIVSWLHFTPAGSTPRSGFGEWTVILRRPPNPALHVATVNYLCKDK